MTQHRSWIGILLALAGTTVSSVFLANLTFGIVEIPDNFPLVGNLDEVVVSAILFSCLNYLGINLIPGTRSRFAAKQPEVIDSPR